ncbi:hypothetical protein MUK42_25706 [Musa troglodytarum]|uniref:Uncharacterized protein n=1 Tax=Musa troglodytarum TaxID=320322 RepID=A0A9E7GTK8_9LILI|nr:hypothetical protein MUK42_25706 [Musa troglodytarum]
MGDALIDDGVNERVQCGTVASPTDHLRKSELRCAQSHKRREVRCSEPRISARLSFLFVEL